MKTVARLTVMVMVCQIIKTIVLINREILNSMAVLIPMAMVFLTKTMIAQLLQV